MTLRRAALIGHAPRCLAATALVVAATAAGSMIGHGTALADEPYFAPAATAAIHPGVMMTSPAGQCTANFVFSSQNKLYLGQAAHCTGTGSETETNGCTSRSMPLDTPIKIDGASRPGRLVYNSWLAMHDRHETNADACGYNDFALVQIDDADVPKVNPTVPAFGGPTGLREYPLPAGSAVYSFQNSGLRQGIGELAPKQGVALGDSAGGYSHEVATASPGVPGDSGSGFMDADGNAFGVLSTLNLNPAPGTNGVGDLAKEIDYASTNGDVGDITLEKGTSAFRNPLPPLSPVLSPAAGSAPAQAAAHRAAAPGPGEGTAVAPRNAAPRRDAAGLLGGR